MLTCKEKSFAFLHIPNCGGSSVRQMLTGIKKVEWREIGHRGPSIKHTHLDGLSGIKDFNIYCNIRNPFTRIVSIYEKRRQQSAVNAFRYMNFEQFFYDQYLGNKGMAHTPIHEYFIVKGKIPGNINFVPLEGANESWPKIIKQYFDTVVNLPHINSTIHKNDMGYFDNQMMFHVKQKEWWACEQYSI